MKPVSTERKTSTAKVNRWERITALGCYLGLAPFARLGKNYQQSKFLRVHCNQALALFALLGAMVLLMLALVLGLSYGMIYHRALVDRWPTELWLLSLGRKLLIVWGVFWGYGLLRTLRGIDEPIPFLGILTRSTVVRMGGMASVCIIVVVGLALVSTAWLADRLVTDDEGRGRVFMVYDDSQQFPRAVFSLAMLRVSTAATRRWGQGSVVLLPLTHDAVARALRNGAFVIIASHGTQTGLLMEEGYFRPEDVPHLDAASAPFFVYLAGCDSGVQREAWETALAPAQLKAYSRMTPVIEHAWWLWTRGPRVVHQLPE